MGWIADKREYRRLQARVEALPPSYGTAFTALVRYMSIFGNYRSGPLLTMLRDLVELLEQSAADHVGVRPVVGDDPVEFAEVFMRNYGEGAWITRERERLTGAIDTAESQEGSR